MPVDTAEVITRLRAAGCVFAEDEAALLVAHTPDPSRLETLLARRVDGEPLETILGWAEFARTRIVVAPGVFVPRRRTELLARIGVRLTLAAFDEATVLDLCCGTGAVAAVVATQVPHAQVLAADIETAAVACARQNLPSGHVHHGDLFAALPTQLRGRLDVVLANAPYVPSAQIAMMPREARDHEPAVALDGGGDGVAVQRRVIAEAATWLRAGGWLAIETSLRQAQLSAQAMVASGFCTATMHVAALDATVVLGQLHRDPTPDIALADAIRAELRAAADPAKAPQMQRYMKSQMPYLGVPVPAVRAVVRSTVRRSPAESAARTYSHAIIHGTAALLWQQAEHREERYAATELLALTSTALTRARLTPPDLTPQGSDQNDSASPHTMLPLLERMIRTGAWWDHVDATSHLVGALLLTDRTRLTPTMHRWSRDPDLWIRRSSVICQLGHKEHTDTQLLTRAIEANLDDDEFFIRKAIGWALRDYARTAPNWVRDFVTTHPTMSPLSVREATKHL